ncbi:hypothetical protein AB0G87_32070 [Streptomyces asoensis]|uniref:hypothetical protein n=1 Tax=Streptomyces asoensis TaxID=249586 RepID=UPI0034035741
MLAVRFKKGCVIGAPRCVGRSQPFNIRLTRGIKTKVISMLKSKAEIAARTSSVSEAS